MGTAAVITWNKFSATLLSIDKIQIFISYADNSLQIPPYWDNRPNIASNTVRRSQLHGGDTIWWTKKYKSSYHSTQTVGLGTLYGPPQLCKGFSHREIGNQLKVRPNTKNRKVDTKDTSNIITVSNAIIFWWQALYTATLWAILIPKRQSLEARDYSCSRWYSV